MKTNWSVKDIPEQTGRHVLITGATSGLGFESALALAGAGAKVTLTGRNVEKAQQVLATIRQQYPQADIEFMPLNLSSLTDIAQFAAEFKQRHATLDVLINNAGVMTPPVRYETEDGFELQFGSNYLGHFALTAHLLPLLKRGHQPRVVSLSSSAHKLAADIHFDDLQWQKKYRAMPAYAQSKLAMLMFAFELQRQSDVNGWGIMSNAAHPGFARTGLQATGPKMGLNGKVSLTERLITFVEPFVSQSAAEGALPTLYAATSIAAQPSGYYGPQRFYELKGPVGNASVARRAKDEHTASRLWQVSTQLTQVNWS